MKTYTLSFRDALEHVPEHMDRTAFKNMPSGDYQFKVWPSEASMRKTVQMQGRRSYRQDDWKIWSDSNMAERLIKAGVIKRT